MKAGQIETILYPVADTKEEALVFVPERYSPLYKYGILFFFDGLDYWRQGMLSSVITEHFGGRLPFLLALLPVAPERRRQAYDFQGEHHDDLMHAVAGPLLRTLEERFALLPLRAARAIGGSSLGAAMALSTITHYPRRFGHLYAQSPAYSGALAAHLQGARPTLLSGLDAHLIVGAKEDGEAGDRDFVAEARACAKDLQQAGAHAHLEIRPGNHGWDAWQTDLPAILQSFASQLSLREDRT